MAQLTIYLPDPVAEAARGRARKGKQSLSAWVAELVKNETGAKWPKELLDVLDSGRGDLVEPDDPAPEEAERLR